MKIKRLNVYLSLVAFVQILVFAIGSDFISEFRKPNADNEWLIFDFLIGLVATLAASLIYVVVFKDTAKHKK